MVPNRRKLQEFTFMLWSHHSVRRVLYNFLGDGDVENPFWRIAVSDKVSECAVLSSKDVEMLDTRVRLQMLVL